MKKLLVAGAAIAALGVASQAHAVTWTGYGNDTLGPALVITISSAGVASIASGPGSAQGPYDGSDDSYIGVVNNYGKTINSLSLSSSGAPIFAFDGDGIDTYGAVKVSGNPDTTGYGGPTGYFTNITSFTSGTVNFFGGVASGGTAFFSLEAPPSLSTFTGPGGGVTTGGVPEPATWAMMLVGVGLMGGMLRMQGRKVVA